MSQGLEESLDALLDAMTRAGVPVAPALRPGLAPADQAVITAALPFALPEQLVALHRWRDGTDWGAIGHANPEVAPYGAYLSLAEAAAAYAEERGRARAVDPPGADAVWDPRWFPLFERGSGDMVVVACGPGPDEGAVIETRREEPDGTVVLHPDIAEMVAFLTRAHATGAITTAEVDGFRQVVDDPRALAAIRRELRPPDPDQLRQWVDGLGRSRQAFLHLRQLLPPEIVPDLRLLAREGSPAARSDAAMLLEAIGA